MSKTAPPPPASDRGFDRPSAGARPATRVRITRPELVWPGKYDEAGSLALPPPVRLPFQTIESVGESRATREARKRRGPSLFATWDQSEGDTYEEGWTNKLIWGDNLLVMQSLLDRFAGKIDLIYIDPPFLTGADFSVPCQVGDSRERIPKKQSILEEKAFRDTWGRGLESYFGMFAPRLHLLRDLLSESGSLFVHLGIQVNHSLRLMLEEVFGVRNVVDEVIWSYGTPSGGRAAAKKIIKAHEYIIVATKRYGTHKYNKAFLPYTDKYVRERFVHCRQDGRRYRSRKRVDKRTRAVRYDLQFLDESPGVPLSSVWTDIKQTYAMHLKKRAVEETGFPTQKPEALLERIIRIASDRGDLVADFFCGSGTTLAVAERLGRRWIGCDLGRWAIHVSRKRLLDIEECRPFHVLNLGKYERQHWQGTTFPTEDGAERQATYEYLAFVLRLYGAAPVPGMERIHGRKGRALVHVGAVDAPVTVADIESALGECVAVGRKELHVLGWEWGMGVGSGTDTGTGGLIHGLARQRGVKVRLLRIPREVMEQQAADAGDIRFFEMAHLDAEIERLPRCWHRVRLSDFVVPNPEEVPSKVRVLITKWSDWVDYWAVDWDFRGDSFRHGFVAYRTRRDRTLELTSDRHQYQKPGQYRVVVQVVDIFGNDTSRAFDIQIP